MPTNASSASSMATGIASVAPIRSLIAFLLQPFVEGRDAVRVFATQAPQRVLQRAGELPGIARSCDLERCVEPIGAQLGCDAIEHRRRRRAQIAERGIADHPHDLDVLQLRVGAKRKPDALPEDIAAVAHSARDSRSQAPHAVLAVCLTQARSTPLQDRNADRFEESGRHDVELRGEVILLARRRTQSARGRCRRDRRCRMRGRSRRIAHRAVRQSAPGAQGNSSGRC